MNERAPAGPDRIQVANLQLTSDQAVHIAALRRRAEGTYTTEGPQDIRPRRPARTTWMRSSAPPQPSIASPSCVTVILYHMREVLRWPSRQPKPASDSSR